jgi:cytochrome b
MMVRVWDPLVRIFHWSLVASFALAWFTSGSRGDLHHWAGYAAASLIFMRLLWGFLGTPYARFSQFVRSPKAVVTYLRAIIVGNEARYVGHNPAGGIMILALMSAIAITAFTGWMMTTDTYYGEDWVQILHSLCADGVLLLVLIHVGGVALASFHHEENLIKAMFSGRKRGAENNDVA